MSKTWAVSLNVEMHKYGAITHCYSIIDAICAFDLEQEKNTDIKDIFSNCASKKILFRYVTLHHLQDIILSHAATFMCNIVHSITLYNIKAHVSRIPDTYTKEARGPCGDAWVCAKPWCTSCCPWSQQDKAPPAVPLILPLHYTVQQYIFFNGWW